VRRHTVVAGGVAPPFRQPSHHAGVFGGWRPTATRSPGWSGPAGRTAKRMPATGSSTDAAGRLSPGGSRAPVAARQPWSRCESSATRCGMRGSTTFGRSPHGRSSSPASRCRGHCRICNGRGVASGSRTPPLDLPGLISPARSGRTPAAGFC